MRTLNVQMGDAFDKLLSEEAELASTTEIDVIRTAVAVFAYLNSEVRSGSQIWLIDRDGRKTTLNIATCEDTPEGNS